MNAHDRDDEVRARLGALRWSAEQRGAALADGFDAIVEAATDVATDDEHDPEGHTIAWERQQVAALLADTRETVAGIEAAEQRLDDGRYGTCTVCDRAIAPERLEALPATPSCIACAPLAPRRSRPRRAPLGRLHAPADSAPSPAKSIEVGEPAGRPRGCSCRAGCEGVSLSAGLNSADFGCSPA